MHVSSRVSTIGRNSISLVEILFLAGADCKERKCVQLPTCSSDACPRRAWRGSSCRRPRNLHITRSRTRWRVPLTMRDLSLQASRSFEVMKVHWVWSATIGEYHYHGCKIGRQCHAPCFVSPCNRIVRITRLVGWSGCPAGGFGSRPADPRDGEGRHSRRSWTRSLRASAALRGE